MGAKRGLDYTCTGDTATVGAVQGAAAPEAPRAGARTRLPRPGRRPSRVRDQEPAQKRVEHRCGLPVPSLRRVLRGTVENRAERPAHQGARIWPRRSHGRPLPQVRSMPQASPAAVDRTGNGRVRVRAAHMVRDNHPVPDLASPDAVPGCVPAKIGWRRVASPDGQRTAHRGAIGNRGGANEVYQARPQAKRRAAPLYLSPRTA